MSSIVPYRNPFVSRAIVKYGAGYARRAFPRLNAAYRVGRFVYKNRSKIKRAYMASRQIVRYSRKRKMTFAARQMEREPKRRAPAKMDPFQDSSFQLECVIGELYVRVLPLPNPPTATNVSELGVRTSFSVMVKGYKICRHFFFGPGQEGFDPVPPIKLTYYLVQPKAPDLSPNQFDINIKDGFFRSHADPEDRQTSFDNTAPWSSVKLCAPLNPDKNFNILKKMTRIMRQNEGDTGPGAYPYNVWMIDRYCKIGKTLTWNNQEEILPMHPIYEIWWYETLNSFERPSVLQSFQGVRTWANHILYYDNKKLNA